MALTNYLADEQARNHASVQLFADILKAAYPEHKVTILVGHHICFMFNDDFDTMDEIPAADSLIFDPELMFRVFGQRSLDIMARLATLPLAERDAELRREFYATKREAYNGDVTRAILAQYSKPLQLHEV